MLERVDVIGAESIDADALRAGLATQQSPTFLFMRGIVYDYEVLDEALLERDLERVERFYQARGYYEAKVTAARVLWVGPHAVQVTIRVDEGAPVRLPRAAEGPLGVQLNGLETIEDASTVASLITSSPRPGTILDEADYERGKAEMRRTLADHGYAFAAVSGRVSVDLARHEARVQFQIEAGPKATLGPISIAGLEQVPEKNVRQSLSIAEGDDYSAATLEDARRALVNLGVFASVGLETDTSQPATRQVPVRFTVRETAPRTIRLGGGARLDALQLSASLTGSWEHRNFLGGLRHLSIEAKPGVGLFPTRMSDFPNLAAPNRVMLEGSLDARFTQPSFLEGRTQGLLSTSLDVHPLLYSDTRTNEAVIGFLELGARAGLERPFLSHRLFLTPSLNWQVAIPVDYRELSAGELSPPVVTRELDNLFIFFPELIARLDLRDDPLDPLRGLLLSNSIQVAVPALGGGISDLRIRPEARFYVTKTNLTLALRATTGLLFPNDYAAGQSVNDITTNDQETLLFRGFFSGGAFSNRGYASQGVGPQHSFILSTDAGVRCNVPGAEAEAAEDPRCSRPVGGLTLWEMSVELRFRPRSLQPLGVVLFLDSSDVRFGRAEYSLGSTHLAPGFGLRYPTPVGPIRLDLGFRLLEYLGKEQPQGVPPTIFGAPMTLHLAVGQAF